MADVWDSELEGSTAVHVMAVLANSADDDGTNCFPGTRLIARRARVSERHGDSNDPGSRAGGLAVGYPAWLGKGIRTEYRLNVNRLHAQAEKTRAAGAGAQKVSWCHLFKAEQAKGDICAIEKVTSAQQKVTLAAGPYMYYPS
jgi:hypothetical protein